MDEPSEYVFGECKAFLFVRESGNWKDLADGGLSQILLVRQNARPNLTLYKIYGKLESTGQVILNIVLDRDVKYEVLEDKSYHHLMTKSNTYLLKISVDSNGEEFAVVVKTIIRSIQDNAPPSPREAWTSPSASPAAKKQKHVVLPLEKTAIVNEQLLLNSQDSGRESPYYTPQPITIHGTLGTGLSGSTSPRPSLRDMFGTYRPGAAQRQPIISPRTATAQSAALALHRPAQAQRAYVQNTFEEQVDLLCVKLSEAILNGDKPVAIETAKLMSEQRIELIIKLRNPKVITMDSNSDSFNLRVVVEDRETSGGTFEMKVSSRTTVQALQEEVADRYGFPPKVQKWIVGKKMAKPTDTLVSLNIKNTGYTAFLYLVSGINAGLTREEFDYYIDRSQERRSTGPQMSMNSPTTSTRNTLPTAAVRSGTQLPRATSLPSLNTTRQLNETTSQTVEEMVAYRRQPQISNASEPIGIPVLAAEPGGIPVQRDADQGGQGRLIAAQSIADIEQMLFNMNDGGAINQQAIERMGQEESEVEPQGWSCPSCTFVNTPTRPGCEVCGENRPADYVVPQNPRITEQERLRLEKEQEEMEIFQRVGMLRDRLSAFGDVPD